MIDDMTVRNLAPNTMLYYLKQAHYLVRYFRKSPEQLSPEDISNVSKLKKQGKSLAETIAAKPTAAYDAKWGQFLMTPAIFTKLVYSGV